MQAILHTRTDRAFRFAFYSALITAFVIVAFLAMINVVALAMHTEHFIPDNVDEAIDILPRIVLTVMAAGIIGSMIGFATVLITERIRAWRILGVCVALIGVFYGAYVLVHWWYGHMYFEGFALEFIVAISVVGAGALAIKRSHRLVIEKL